MPVWQLHHCFSSPPHHSAVSLPTKVEDIIQFKQSFTLKGLPEFVDMVNFYYLFVPVAAKMMPPLYSALVGKPKSPKTLEWTEPIISAFQDPKAALVRAAMLMHQYSETPTSLSIDEPVLGAVIQQFLMVFSNP